MFSQTCAFDSEFMRGFKENTLKGITLIQNNSFTALGISFFIT